VKNPLGARSGSASVGVIEPLEAHELEGQRGVERAGELVVGAAEIELGHAVVRGHDGRERVLQRLEALHARLQRIRRAPERAAVGDVRVLRQVADRNQLHLACQVHEIEIVRHPVVVHLGHGAEREALGVLPRDAFARGAGLAVLGQVLEPELAGVGTSEITRLALQLVAALAHDDRGKRGVVLGRDVPVVRNAELEAALAGLRVVRRQQAALAPLADREHRVGRGDDGGIEKADPRIDRRALLLLEVHLELARFDAPVLLLGTAGGVVGVDEAVAPGPEELQALGGSARGALALDQVARAVEHPGVVERVVVQPRAEEAVGAALQAHPALALGAPELAVVAQALAEDAHVVAPDLGVAARAHLEVAHALDGVGFDGGAVDLGLRLCALRGCRRGGGERGREHREAHRHGAGDVFPWC
jgi:hypothetical protein